jgi:hypothetical protein
MARVAMVSAPIARGFLAGGSIPTAALVGDRDAGGTSESHDGETGNVIWRCRIYSNVSPREVLKKVLGTPAVVVNDDRIESLLSEMRSELIDQSAAIVWHGNLLARLR